MPAYIDRIALVLLIFLSASCFDGVETVTSNSTEAVLFQGALLWTFDDNEILSVADRVVMSARIALPVPEGAVFKPQKTKFRLSDFRYGATIGVLVYDGGNHLIEVRKIRGGTDEVRKQEDKNTDRVNTLPFDLQSADSVLTEKAKVDTLPFDASSADSGKSETTEPGRQASAEKPTEP